MQHDRFVNSGSLSLENGEKEVPAYDFHLNRLQMTKVYYYKAIYVIDSYYFYIGSYTKGKVDSMIEGLHGLYAVTPEENKSGIETIASWYERKLELCPHKNTSELLQAGYQKIKDPIINLWIVNMFI